MNRTLTLVFLVAGFVAATSPVWAFDPGNPAFTPDPASPGATISFTASITDATFDPAGTTCDVYADTAEPAITAAACNYNKGRVVRGSIMLATDATGPTYLVRVCGPSPCAGSEVSAEAWTLANDLRVTLASVPPAPSSITVPTLRCSNAYAGFAALQGAGLQVATPGSSFVIGSQAPSAGATVASGARATIYPARVPQVVGLDYSSAVASVVAACGSPTAAGGTAGTVRLQSPPPSSALPERRAVLLTVAQSPLPHPPPWWLPFALAAGAVASVGLVVLIVSRAVRARPETEPDQPHVEARVRRNDPRHAPLPIPPGQARPTVSVLRRVATYQNAETP